MKSGGVPPFGELLQSSGRFEFAARGASFSLASKPAFYFSTACPTTLYPRIIRRETSGEREPMSENANAPALRVKGRLMSASEIERTLVRLAHEIVEKSNGSEDLTLIGIKRRGVPLAERLGKLISGIEKRSVDTGMLDIQFYRDDLSTADVRPVVTPGSLGCDVEGRDVVLCDDVLYTGRTIRAALDALFDHGRPRRVQLAVLIDRGHRELPIEATYVGRHVPTSSREIIEVKFHEVDNDDQVLLVERVD